MNNSRTQYPFSEETPANEGTSVEAIDGGHCPECTGVLTVSADSGERVCEDCGLVTETPNLDHGPEWRAFTTEEQHERRRTGAPATELLHDKGLSTQIGWRNKDARGNPLVPAKRKRLRRLRTMDERYRAKSHQERNLIQALSEISRMAAALGLPKPCRETAAVIYREALENDLLPGRSIEAMASASVYAASRQHKTPRRLVSVADVSRVDKLPVQRAYRYLDDELNLEIEPTDPELYLRQYAGNIAVSPEAERLARELLDIAKHRGIHSGRSPAGMAAAALYAAARLTNHDITQATVSDVANISEVTIRTRYQELLEAYGAHHDE